MRTASIRFDLTIGVLLAGALVARAQQIAPKSKVAAPATTSRQTAKTTPDRRMVEAVKSGDRARAIALIGRRLDVNVPEVDGTTALHWAVHHDDGDLVERLI